MPDYQDKSFFGEVTSLDAYEEIKNEELPPDLSSPEDKFKKYQNWAQKSQSQHKANAEIKEYKRLAIKWALNPETQDCVDKYKQFLKTKKPKPYAYNTMQNKLAHVQTYLKKGCRVDVNVKLGKVSKSQTNPHKAYELEDIEELVKQLRHQTLERLENEQASEEIIESK